MRPASRNVPRVHNGLKALLYVISALQGVAGVMLLFASQWVLGMGHPLLGFGGEAVALAFLKAIGIAVLGFAYLTCVAARDPVRYVAIVDTLIFLALAAAVLNIYTIAYLHVSPYYTLYLMGRTVIQLAIGIALIALRPKRTANVPS
jgi:hypothetical protein